MAMELKVDKQTAKAVIVEALQRQKRKQTLVDSLFEKQKDFVLDPSRYKSSLCTRRSGKSYGAGAYLFLEALSQPNVSVLYVTLTRLTAKNIMFKDVLKVINRKHGLNATFNESLLTVTLPNGSVIYLFGIDSSPDEAEKILGQKFKLVIVDEAGSISYDLRDIVQRIINPTLIDYQGTLCLLGTPTDLVTGLFYDVTNGIEKGYVSHKWSALDNPHIAQEFQIEIDTLIANNPDVIHTAWFKQMYKGEWCINLEKLVYKFNPDKNYYDTLPDNDYIYILGIDLGWEDDSAFTVGAYSTTDKHLYILHSYKRPKMLLSDVEAYIQELRVKYSISKFVIDNADKQSVEEMKHRTGIPLIPADKKDKMNFIEIMNNDLANGKIKVCRTTTQSLVDEWSKLIKDDDGKEHKLCANHCADSALYMFRYSFHYLSQPIIPKVKKPDVDIVDDWWDKEAEMIEAKKRLDLEY